MRSPAARWQQPPPPGVVNVNTKSTNLVFEQQLLFNKLSQSNDDNLVQLQISTSYACAAQAYRVPLHI